jgi:hypothetical protein
VGEGVGEGVAVGAASDVGGGVGVASSGAAVGAVVSVAAASCEAGWVGVDAGPVVGDPPAHAASSRRMMVQLIHRESLFIVVSFTSSGDLGYCAFTWVAGRARGSRRFQIV